MRIIYDNKADSATIAASSTSGSLVATNMQNDYKGKVHRSETNVTTVTYTLTWAQAQSIGGIGLPATNLSRTATIRVKLYSGASVVADSGVITASSSSQTTLWNWSNPLNVNSFAYGGATKTAVWFNQHYNCTKVEIILTDLNNLVGYIDCARIVCGAYWEPKYNVSNGIVYTLGDTTNNIRNDSGDLLSDRGFVYDQLSFNLSVLLEAEKSALVQIFKGIGTSKNIFISLFPESNSTREQEYIIYGKRQVGEIITQYYGIYNHTMNIEGW